MHFGGAEEKASFGGIVSNRLQGVYGYTKNSWNPQTLHNEAWFAGASLILAVITTFVTWRTNTKANTSKPTKITIFKDLNRGEGARTGAN